MSESNIFGAEMNSADTFFAYGQALRLPKNGKPDYEKAIKMYLLAAESDYTMGEIYSKAYFFVGQCYENLGQPEKAFSYFMKSISSKSAIPEAQNAVGTYYYVGKGGAELSYKKAKIFYEKAAAQNLSSALFNLGLYHSNKNVPDADDSVAFKFFKKAADNGHVRAIYRLGLCYKNGTGVEANTGTACEYMMSIAEKYSYARSWLGDYYRDINEPKKAIYWYERCIAEDNDKTAEKKIKEIKDNDIPNLVISILSAQDNDVFPDMPALEEQLGELNGETLYDRALTKEKEGDKACAVKLFTLSAVKGCRKARYTLANMAAKNSEYFKKIKNF